MNSFLSLMIIKLYKNKKIIKICIFLFGYNFFVNYLLYIYILERRFKNIFKYY